MIYLPISNLLKYKMDNHDNVLKSIHLNVSESTWPVLSIFTLGGAALLAAAPDVICERCPECHQLALQHRHAAQWHINRKQFSPCFHYYPLV